MTRPRDPHTQDLFEVPAPAASLPGGMDYRTVVSGLVSQMLKGAEGDRFKIAAEASRLAGKEVSKYMLDAYSSEARDEFNLPLYLVPALESACESHTLTNWLADTRGGRLLIGRDALNAELGKLERAKEDATKKIRELKKLMGEME